MGEPYLLHKPELTKVIRTSDIKIIHYSKVTNSYGVHKTQGCCVIVEYIHAELWGHKCGAYSERPTPPVEEDTLFPNTHMVLGLDRGQE